MVFWVPFTLLSPQGIDIVFPITRFRLLYQYLQAGVYLYLVNILNFLLLCFLHYYIFIILLLLI